MFLAKENTLLRQEKVVLEQQLSEALDKIQKLEGELARLQNANVPPSVQKSPFGPKVARVKSEQHSESQSSPVGRKPGHEGVTRSTSVPQQFVELTLEHCPFCGALLDQSQRKLHSRSVHEDLPPPESIQVIEYCDYWYSCGQCQEFSETHRPGWQLNSVFGPRLHALIVLYTFRFRLPVRKVAE